MNPRLRKDGKNYFTLSLVKNPRVYGERIVTDAQGEWREWNPFRSKLAAALGAGLSDLPIGEGSSVLYLGSAEGTTVSHVSDLVGENGIVVGVDISPKAMTSFAKLVEVRENIVPILGDANVPEEYGKELGDFSADVMVQDVAQRNQADIFVKNMTLFGRKGSDGLLVIKARSVDFTMDPRKVLEGELKIIKKHYTIVQVVELGKFEKDHFLIHCRY
ncbi:MAG: fibrillarin-like rRNA/tRNA 2'-O-methyltransferase [archaeon]